MHSRVRAGYGIRNGLRDEIRQDTNSTNEHERVRADSWNSCPTSFPRPVNDFPVTVRGIGSRVEAVLMDRGYAVPQG